MGLSTKHVSGDQQGFDWPSWGKDTLQPGAPELPKPPPPEPLSCPRCSSANTKFCYYNNYNKSQPRHFCKSCKRHWTKGGTLRNVPVGGGRKNNKRPRVSNAAAAAAGGRPNFPASANNNTGNNNNNQKGSMSNILYQALIGSPLLHEKSDIININNNNSNINVGDTSAGQDRNSEFDHQFSSLGTFFDMNNTSNNNPVSYQSLIGYDSHYPGNLDSIEESTVTTVNNVPWPGPDTGSTLDLPNYWSWSEIDVLASSDHLNLSWDGTGENDNDDLEIKLP